MTEVRIWLETLSHVWDLHLEAFPPKFQTQKQTILQVTENHLAEVIVYSCIF